MREGKTHPALSPTPGNDKAPLILGGEVQLHNRLLRLVVVDENDWSGNKNLNLVVVDERPVEDHVGAPRERKVQLVNSR